MEVSRNLLYMSLAVGQNHGFRLSDDETVEHETGSIATPTDAQNLPRRDSKQSVLSCGMRSHSVSTTLQQKSWLERLFYVLLMGLGLANATGPGNYLCEVLGS